jgi:hypothetical protein
MFHKPRKPLKRSPIKQKPVIAVVQPTKNTTPTTRVKKPRKQRTPRQKAKDNAWSAFSYYIRIRDSLATTGTITHCVCVTCRERGDLVPKPFAKIQAGHGVGGRGNAVLFHEQIVNGQCDYCNSKPPMGLGGDYGNYVLYFVKTYGLRTAEAFQHLRHATKVYKTHDFLAIEAKYKHMVAELLKE